jgi:hypothetical protein
LSYGKTSSSSLSQEILDLPPSKQRRQDQTTPSSHNFVSEYSSPLELLIQDKQREVVKRREKVLEIEEEFQCLSSLYGKKPNIDYFKPACTNCHRREGHNRINCPYKGHPCLSAEFCGDINKHKNEKDILSEKNNLLQSQTKNLQKLKNGLQSKLALKNQVTSSFSSIMRSRLINECTARYLNPYGFENWRQVNIDLKKLEAHFKGRIPSIGVSLIEALEDYEKKILNPSNRKDVSSNPMRSLWELKGLTWPSAEESEVTTSLSSSPSDVGGIPSMHPLTAAL